MKWYVASLAPEDKEYLRQCHDEDTIRMMLTSRHSTDEIPFCSAHPLTANVRLSTDSEYQ